MSREESQENAFDHLVAELRCEGVAISDDIAQEVVSDYYSKPIDERISPMPGFELNEPSADSLAARA